MGGSVSTGIDNDDLIDNLREADYMRTSQVERVFRAVDRGEYILPEYRMSAYKDQAWRGNRLHLSAPCIYSEVMEALCLEPGVSFLNLGSGTGYLSTMAGLIIGYNGINHGVEFYDEVVEYAYKKLDEFKKHSGAVDEFDFCEPKFMQGNCLCLTTSRLYDRVYVGAACPEPYETYMKNLLSVGGVLVMPFNDQLLQVKRTSETTWDVCLLLPVSFATLILPKEDSKELIELMDIEPESLQSLCRVAIRNLLRKSVDFEKPHLQNRKYGTAGIVRKHNKKRRVQRLVHTERENEVTDILGLVLDRNFDRDRTLNTLNIRQLSNFTEWLTDEEYDSDSSSDNEQQQKLNAASNSNSEMETDNSAETAGNDEANYRRILSDSEASPTALRKRENVDVDVSSSSSSSEEEAPQENPEELMEKMNQRRTVTSPYTIHIYNKIKELPLPPVLKEYLNFHRTT